MKIAIHQPNFLPWLGYFNKILKADTFVFLDDVQFERGKTFTSRTKIFINGKENWLTIPVINKSELIKIKDIKVDTNFRWKKKHLRTIELNYKKHPFATEIFPIISEVYKNGGNYLMEYNLPLIMKFCNYMKIKTDFINSSNLKFNSDKAGWEKLIVILNEVKADEYLSGSGAGSKRYVKESDLWKNNISLAWQNYLIKPYNQFNCNNFVSGLSIIDLLFNHGKSSLKYL